MNELPLKTEGAGEDGSSSGSSWADVFPEPVAKRCLVFWPSQLCPSKSDAKTTPLSPQITQEHWLNSMGKTQATHPMKNRGTLLSKEQHKLSRVKEWGKEQGPKPTAGPLRGQGERGWVKKMKIPSFFNKKK